MFCWKRRDMYSISDKVAIVTGALGAIGKGLVERLIQRGARVMLVDIQDVDVGDTHAQAINSASGTQVAAYVNVDLRTEEGIKQMFAQTIQTFGRIDILVNNAGLASPTGLYSGSETFDRICNIVTLNLHAPIEATRLFAEHIRSRNQDNPSMPCQGVVVNVASMAGLMPTKDAEVYGAAKAGLLHLTKSSVSLAPMVRVCAVAPYFVHTPMVLDNPKHKNNKTIVPSLMLSVNQVCGTIERCIEDVGSAGNVYTMMGCVTYRRVWLFEIAWIQVMALAVWAMLLLPFKRLFCNNS
ncbi:hypothetical protein LPJ59_004789 [Coemansia sp. RSA 2399]|nr:hypothetical protein LPJ59_004789 [Coemansia sp. RSA 2399]KAJ1895805.1 hypothetical protein LPJ81_004884 [Coemansia sp. IMI 209127]